MFSHRPTLRVYKTAGHQHRLSLWTGALVEEKPLHFAHNTHTYERDQRPRSWAWNRPRTQLKQSSEAPLKASPKLWHFFVFEIWTWCDIQGCSTSGQRGLSLEQSLSRAPTLCDPMDCTVLSERVCDREIGIFSHRTAYPRALTT